MFEKGFGVKHLTIKTHSWQRSALLALVLTGAAGCFQSPTASTSSSSSTKSTNLSSVSVPSGPKAVKIFFRQSSTSGSFDAPSGNGTPAVPGSGQKAIRVFNPDGSILASGGYGSTNWPSWLTSFEIGLSGSSNTSAPNSHCARFAFTGEDTGTQCDFNKNANPADPDPVNCGAPPTYLRVSEYDCTRNSDTLDGNGGANDGVYIRATFSRDSTVLAPQENILVVVEYAASGLNPAPPNPTACFSNGRFNPSAPGCSDMTWQIFAKHSASEVLQPFLMLAPPALATVNQQTNTGGSVAGTKQFILPFAADSGLNTLQISRIKALPNGGTTSDFGKICNGSNNPSNSALCVGMIFYSITFYRM